MPEPSPTSPAPDRIVIYTDGACKGNPGPGGWGVWLQSGEYQREMSGGEALTTNNRMELTAVIEALSALKKVPSEVLLYTDSKYVLQGIEQWIHGWKARGWTTAGRAPVKNVDLWKRLDELAQRHHIEWAWVRGHTGDYGNEKADALANAGVAQFLPG